MVCVGGGQWLSAYSLLKKLTELLVPKHDPQHKQKISDKMLCLEAGQCLLWGGWGGAGAATTHRDRYEESIWGFTSGLLEPLEPLIRSLMTSLTGWVQKFWTWWDSNMSRPGSGKNSFGVCTHAWPGISNGIRVMGVTNCRRWLLRQLWLVSISREQSSGTL